MRAGQEKVMEIEMDKAINVVRERTEDKMRPARNKLRAGKEAAAIQSELAETI
jgi:hypothetical protein